MRCIGMSVWAVALAKASRKYGCGSRAVRSACASWALPPTLTPTPIIGVSMTPPPKSNDVLRGT